MSSSGNRRFRPHPLLPWHEESVHVSGTHARVIVEASDRPEKIDHVWIDLEAGEAGTLRLSLSTWSRQSRAAGFDPRVWLGLAQSTWTELPKAGVTKTSPLNYATIEAAHAIDYRARSRQELEQILVEKTQRAIWVEAWGDLYARGHAGVHQIHSRRASFAVPIDHVGRDGAIQFYYEEDAVREMLLFKFAGQA